TIGTRSSQAQTAMNLRPSTLYALSIPGVGMIFLTGWSRQRRNYKLLSIGLLSLTFVLIPGCGGGGGHGSNFTPPPPPVSVTTPSGTSTVTITATSGTLQHTVTVSLTVQ